jgi:AraC-like DNA-binding protein
MQSFTTSGLDPRRKLAYWNERAGESFSPLVSDPADIRAFHGSIERTAFGDLTLAEACTEAQTVRHSRAHVARTRGSLFFLMLQLSGESRNRQDGREAFLRPGDFTLCDTTQQYEIVFPGANRMLVLGIPDVQLRRQIACPESLVAVPVRAGSGAAALFSRFLRDFWVACHQGLDPEAAARVSAAVLDLLGATYADVPRAHCERPAVATTQRIRILKHIEAVQLGRTVAEIAFDHGFNSPTHFGRAFRCRFGMTPREYRECQAAATTDGAATVPPAGAARVR